MTSLASSASLFITAIAWAWWPAARSPNILVSIASDFATAASILPIAARSEGLVASALSCFRSASKVACSPWKSATSALVPSKTARVWEKCTSPALARTSSTAIRRGVTERSICRDTDVVCERPQLARPHRPSRRTTTRPKLAPSFEPIDPVSRERAMRMAQRVIGNCGRRISALAYARVDADPPPPAPDLRRRRHAVGEQHRLRRRDRRFHRLARPSGHDRRGRAERDGRDRARARGPLRLRDEGVRADPGADRAAAARRAPDGGRRAADRAPDGAAAVGPARHHRRGARDADRPAPPPRPAAPDQGRPGGAGAQDRALRPRRALPAHARDAGEDRGHLPRRGRRRAAGRPQDVDDRELTEVRHPAGGRRRPARRVHRPPAHVAPGGRRPAGDGRAHPADYEVPRAAEAVLKVGTVPAGAGTVPDSR